MEKIGLQGHKKVNTNKTGTQKMHLDIFPLDFRTDPLGHGSSKVGEVGGIKVDSYLYQLLCQVLDAGETQILQLGLHYLRGVFDGIEV
ncbi:hypothetical protein E2C01_037456 [Portunus trituberculatus]|uniref:Uncharacterized protein n=1 Tax=Portunus trituberculatus TaxID=210409 RepID=A0A5B7FFC7_PORTR|nr:hypothetical protein [Portunus trituberculatus]